MGMRVMIVLMETLVGTPFTAVLVMMKIGGQDDDVVYGNIGTIIFVGSRQ